MLVSCNDTNYTSFKDYIDIVNNQKTNEQDIFVFKTSSCSSCKEIQPYLDKYKKENDNKNLRIHYINLAVSINNKFKDETLGTCTGNVNDDGTARLDKRINSIVYQNNVKTGVKELIYADPYGTYIYMRTPLIIWYQNNIEYKISNTIIDYLKEDNGNISYDSFKNFMEFPKSSLYLNIDKFNITSL